MVPALHGSRLMADDKDRPFTCEKCGAWPMKLVGVTPKIDSLPELRTFRCEYCGNIDTVPLEDD